MEKILKEKLVYDGKVFKVFSNTVLCEGERECYRDIVAHNGGVGVLPLDDEGYVYLVKQFRSGAGEHLIEIPAGKLELAEEHFECAVRELSEETGFTANALKYIGFLYPTPAYDTEKIHIYIATGLIPGDAHPDDGEELEMIRIKLSDAVQMTENGEITDAKTVIALLRAERELR